MSNLTPEVLELGLDAVMRDIKSAHQSAAASAEKAIAVDFVASPESFNGFLKVLEAQETRARVLREKCLDMLRLWQAVSQRGSEEAERARKKLVEILGNQEELAFLKDSAQTSPQNLSD